MSTLLMVLVIVAVGARMGDGLRLRQQEAVLSKLPEGEARAYYHVLRRRARKVILLRAIAVLSLLIVAYTYRLRMAPPPAYPAARAAGAAGS